MSLVVKLSFEKLFEEKLVLLPLLSGLGLIAKNAKRKPVISSEMPMIPKMSFGFVGIIITALLSLLQVLISC